MKQKILLLLTVLFMAFDLTAQWHPGAVIDINNIKTTLYGTGNFFRNRSNSSSAYNSHDVGYFVPAEGTAYTIFQNTLWIGAHDSNGLHLAAVRFNQGPDINGGEDFWSGPLRVNDASTDIYTVMDYHHVWKVSRADIEALIANPGGDIPEDILTWPAHGNVDDGFAANLAPFVDVDGDDIYNPRNGDYPDILGDMALYCIYNDNFDYFNTGVVEHTETGGTPLGVEIHCMLYGFNAPNDEKLNNTLFMRQWIYNRSANTYHDTYVGYWTELDIGYCKDDYVGCNVNNGYFYGYNGAEIDGAGQIEAYGENPPAQLVMILGGPTMNPDGWDNPKYDSGGNQIVDESINGLGFGDGIIDNERLGMTGFVSYNFDYNPQTPIINGEPKYAEDYYNYMRGMWKNGEPMQYGGSGVMGDTLGCVGPACKFMYPYDSDPGNWGTGGILPNGGFNQNGFYWSEETANNGQPTQPNDRRGLASSGPFTFPAGTCQIIDRAYVTCWFTNGFDRTVMDEWAVYIKNYFLNNLYNR